MNNPFPIFKINVIRIIKYGRLSIFRKISRILSLIYKYYQDNVDLLKYIEQNPSFKLYNGHIKEIWKILFSLNTDLLVWMILLNINLLVWKILFYLILTC